MANAPNNQLTQQAREGVRRVPWKTVLAGAGSVSVVTLLAVSGFGPLINSIAAGALSVKEVQDWLANLGANALSGWVADWATGVTRDALADPAERERRAVELEQRAATDPAIAAALAKLLPAIDAVPQSLDSLREGVGAQSDLVLEQNALLERLRADVERAGLGVDELRQFVTSATSQAVINFGGAQVGEVKTGDVAGRDVKKQSITVNVWQWERFAGDDLAWLVQRLSQGGQELRPTDRERWRRVDWSQAAQKYKTEMGRLYGSMHIFGMNRPVPLTDVFTDVYLLDKPSAWRRHSLEELRQRGKLHDATGSDTRHAGGELVAKEPRLFILGQPGAGKTTFLKHLVMETVAGRVNAIPIFVSLKAWADSGLDLMPFLVRQFMICSFPDAQPFIEHIFEGGKAIVLFDGLDEVSDAQEQRQRTTQAIRDFAQQYGKSRVVVTCRTAVTEYTFEGFSYCEIADFTQEQIEAFVGRWFQKDEAKRAAFLEAFGKHENQRLIDLARRPLLLTMLCLTFDETMAFPQRRAELYEEAIDALLKKWDSSRSIQRDQVYRKLSLGHKRQLLTELAAQSYEKGELFLPRRELASRVVRFLRRLPPSDQGEDIDGDAVLRSIEAQHGLLVERARDIYSFSHLTFQEYFTARYIAGHHRDEVRRRAVAQGENTQWREVLLLAASMLDYEGAQPFFRLWTEHLQSMVQSDAALTTLLMWVDQQVQEGSFPPFGLRALVLTIALIDQAKLHLRALVDLVAFARYLDHDLARDFARDLARALTRVRDLACDFARDLRRAHFYVHEIARELEYARDVSRDIAKEISRALGYSRNIERNSDITEKIKLVYEVSFDITHGLEIARSCDVIYRHAIRTRPQNTSAIPRHIPLQDWQLGPEQLDLLEVYLVGTWRLLECLDLATVEDRKAIEDRLLAPPFPS